MADRVVYFPSIRVPPTEWFTRVLLYWDSVATIVPAEYLDDPGFLRPYTSELIDCRLLRAIPPDSVIWKSGARNYSQAFLELVDRHPRLVNGVPLSERPTTRIHTDKTGTGLAFALEQRGLARRLAGPEHATWFEVEKQTAELLMAYLASIVARSEEHDTDPITDRPECLAAFEHVRGHDGAAGGVVNETDPVRTHILRGILPAPAETVSVQDLADFKARHGAALVAFRRTIEQRVLAVAAIDDTRFRARQIDLVTEELQAEVREIGERMRERRWRRIGLGTIGAVVGAGFALADAALNNGSLAITGGSISLVSAVWGAFCGARTPEDLLRRPLAYAAFAERDLA